MPRPVPQNADDSSLSPAAADAVQSTNRLAYSPTELADRLGVTRQHVQNCIRRGEIPSVTLGRRRLIPAAAVAELLSAGGAPDVSAS